MEYLQGLCENAALCMSLHAHDDNQKCYNQRPKHDIDTTVLDAQLRQFFASAVSALHKKQSAPIAQQVSLAAVQRNLSP